MELRQTGWLSVGLGLLLTTGCWWKGQTVREETGDPGSAALASASKPAESVPGPPPLPSDYNLRPAGPASIRTVSHNESEARDRAVPPLTATTQLTSPEKTEKTEKTAPQLQPQPQPMPRATPEAPLVAALRCALENHPDEARKLLERYSQNDRELLLALVRLTAGFGENEARKLSPEEVARAMDQLSAALSGMRARAPLQLDKVCLCKKIQGFGRFVAVPTQHEFEAGQDGRPGERVHVYAEVRNFASKMVDDQHETTLQTTLEICNTERKTVASIELEACRDRSRTPRHDYFLNFQLNVPAGLSPGLYTLWVKVKDVTTSPARETRASVDFKVRAPGSVASVTP
ncbi:MAG: hypothetical protein U0840_02565 [Gemmataceae bacterium]